MLTCFVILSQHSISFSLFVQGVPSQRSFFKVLLTNHYPPSTTHFLPIFNSAIMRSFLFNLLRTLPFSVWSKSFVCHSYENNRGVYHLFPIWNSWASTQPMHGGPAIRSDRLKKWYAPGVVGQPAEIPDSFGRPAFGNILKGPTQLSFHYERPHHETAP
jgi:hypothetical protein